MSDKSNDFAKRTSEAFANMEKLQGTENWTMWNFRINRAIEALDREHLLKDPPKDDAEKKEEKLLRFNIIKAIPDNLMRSFLSSAGSLPSLMEALLNRFSPPTNIQTAYQVQHLFNVSGPVKYFDKTLDKVEQIYSKLKETDAEPSDDIYIAAINNATPPQYRYILEELDGQRKFFNEHIAKKEADKKTYVNPDDLIKALRAAFADYTNSRVTAQRYIHMLPQSNRGRGGFRGGYRGRGRGGNNNNTRGRMDRYFSNKNKGSGTNKNYRNGNYQPKCFNCGRFGHISQQCRDPLKPQAKAAIEKAQAKKSGANVQSVTALAAPPPQAMVKNFDSIQGLFINQDKVNQVSQIELEHPNKRIRLLQDASTSKIEEIPEATMQEIDYTQEFNFDEFIENLDKVSAPFVGHSHALKEKFAILDSGATIHATPYMTDLSGMTQVTPINVYMANGSIIQISQAGMMAISLLPADLRQPSKEQVIVLRNVYYHPQLKFMIISQALLCKQGYKCIYVNDACHVFSRKGIKCGVIKTMRDLYLIRNPRIPIQTLMSMVELSLYDLHCRLGHANYDYIKRIINKLPYKVKDMTERKCETCIEANIKRQVIPKFRTSPLSEKFGDRLHIDIWGPAPVAAIGNIKYFLTTVDDATRWITCLPLKSKDEAFPQYVRYTTRIFTQTGIKIKVLQSDNDTVFLSRDFSEYLDTQGTIRNLTVHDTPQQNGVAERTHQTLLNGVRSLLLMARLPAHLWFEALKNAEYWLNRLPKSAIKHETPYFRRFGQC